MKSFFIRLCIISLFVVSTTESRRLLHSLISRRRIGSDFATDTLAPGDDPSELVKRDGTKYVFMHLIVGNTYSYSIDDWKQDIQQMKAKGVDALALNYGADYWQQNQIQSAYNAAQQLATDFKLFLSPDFTTLPCTVDDSVSRINQFANHPNQFRVNGKVFISSFSGSCLGDSGWASLKAQTNGYIMPFLWGLENQFSNWPSLDAWVCWGCAWPQGNNTKTTSDDLYYINQLGNRYATAVSVWMYTHFADKNFYLRGDDWLIVSRWEQLVSLRNQLTFVEMATWNDFGESDYFGPIKGSQPEGTTWATNFPHTAWFDLSAYYITAFKTGSYPVITQDAIYFWARPHPASATASGDHLPKPSGWNWTEDMMWAAVFATAPATVILKCGSSSNSFTIDAGVSKLKLSLSPGKMTVQMIRNDQMIINYTPDDYTFITDPVTYNYNAWVGSATAGSPGSNPSQTNTLASTLTPSWKSYGCVAEGTTGSRRALTGAQFSRSNMTAQTCQELCSGYEYAGTEYGVECYCGNSLTNNGATGSVIPSSNCAVNCGGDSSHKCGGSWTLSVYSKSSGPSTSQWTNAGCYTDASARALRGQYVLQNGMTTDVCVNICSSGGFTMAATENGTECFCGSQLFKENGGGISSDPNRCSTPCGGNSPQTCGGAWHLNLYLKPGTTI